MDLNRKFVLTLVAYAVLGLGAWLTLEDTPIRLFSGIEIRLRTLTLVLLGVFAFKSFIYWWRCRLEASSERRDSAGDDDNGGGHQ